MTPAFGSEGKFGVQSYRVILTLAALIFCELLLPAPALCSDNDERPAYMIYIDPVTGKYTTENRSQTADAETPAEPDSGMDSERSMVLEIVVSTLLLMVLIGYAIKTRKQL